GLSNVTIPSAALYASAAVSVLSATWNVPRSRSGFDGFTDVSSYVASSVKVSSGGSPSTDATDVFTSIVTVSLAVNPCKWYGWQQYSLMPPRNEIRRTPSTRRSRAISAENWPPAAWASVVVSPSPRHTFTFW